MTSPQQPVPHDARSAGFGIPPRTAPEQNVPGRIGFVLAIVTIAFSLVITVVTTAMFRSADVEPVAVGLLSSILRLFEGLMATAALVFGVIGTRRTGAPMLTSGIAIGVAGSMIIGVVGAFIIPMAASVFATA